MTAALLRLTGVSKTYAGNPPIAAVSKVNLDLETGDFVSIVGPSGCGKSTLFNMIAGVADLTAGEIELEGASEPEERRRRVGYMFQKDLLFPWRSVLNNASLGLEVEGRMSKTAARAKARTLLPRFGLAGFEDQRPAALSGGMRQRVALLRTLLLERPLILLDEPFASLDALTRRELHTWLLATWHIASKAALLVTHDVQEAVLLSNRVFVMGPRPGSLTAEFQVRPAGQPPPPPQERAKIESSILSAMGVGDISP